MKKKALWLLLILCVAAGWKILLLQMDVVPFNADEAVVGLMARHILAGERPIFFYGQSYMGSLDAILVAIGFAIFGQAVWVIRLVQIIQYIFVLLTTAWLAREVTGSSRAGVIAAALLAIPTVNVSLYTTISLGGYLEALLIGNLVLLQAIFLARKPGLARWALWGFLAGLGLWVNGLTLVYSLPAFFYLAYHLRGRLAVPGTLRGLGVAALGGLIGALPWWIYAWQNGLQNLTGELLGSAVSVEQGSWLARTGMHLVNLVLLGSSAIFGFRPPWGIRWLALPILPVALIAWGIVLFHAYRRLKRQAPEYAMLAGVALTLAAGFLFTSFGVDPSGRYFLPLAAPLAILAADFAEKGTAKSWLRTAVPVVIVLYQLAGNLQVALSYPPGFTTQFDATTIVEHRYDDDLIAFLVEKGELRGYGNYWVAYPLAFLSGEEIIYTPRLPYHDDMRYTPRDNRYQPYQEAVEASQKVAYITSGNPNLDQQLERGFASLGVSWEETIIGDYHVYYALTRVVRPEELDLDAATP